MPKYTFVCDKCNEYTELSCSISEYDNKIKKVKCRSCNSKKVHRFYEGDDIRAKCINITTIGQLAEKNAKENKSKVSELIPQKPQKEKPWYHNVGTASNKEINNMTKKQKRDYIMKGKK